MTGSNSNIATTRLAKRQQITDLNTTQYFGWIIRHSNAHNKVTLTQRGSRETRNWGLSSKNACPLEYKLFQLNSV